MTSSTAPRCALALAISFAAACGIDSYETLTDPEDAELCLNGNDGLKILANYGDCLAGGCTSVEDTACTVTVDSDVVSLTTQATLLHTNESSCPANCGAVIVECDAVVLSPGDYEIRYGERIHQLTLPLEPASPLPGMDPGDVCDLVLPAE